MLTLYTIFALKNQQSEVGSASRAMAVEWSFIAFRFVSSSRASSLSSSSSSAPYSFSSPLIFRFPYLFLLFFRVFLSFRSPCRVLPALSSSFSPSSSSSSAPSPFSSWSFGLLVSSLSSFAFSCSWSFSLSLLPYRSPRLLFHFVFLSFLDSSVSSFLLHLPPPPPPTSSWPHLIFQLFFLDLFVCSSRLHRHFPPPFSCLPIFFFLACPSAVSVPCVFPFASFSAASLFFVLLFFHSSFLS